VWHKNIAGRFFGLVTKQACDRRTDGRTDEQNYDSQDRASIAASRGKVGVVFHQGWSESQWQYYYAMLIILLISCCCCCSFGQGSSCIVDPLGLRASGNLLVSYVLTGKLPVTYHQYITGNLPVFYHIVYFLVISKYIGGDTSAKPYN